MDSVHGALQDHFRAPKNIQQTAEHAVTPELLHRMDAYWRAANYRTFFRTSLSMKAVP